MAAIDREREWGLSEVPVAAVKEEGGGQPLKRQSMYPKASAWKEKLVIPCKDTQCQGGDLGQAPLSLYLWRPWAHLPPSYLLNNISWENFLSLKYTVPKNQPIISFILIF